MDGDDAVFAGADDVVCCGAGVVPVPGVEGEADVGAAFDAEFEHLGHLPNELVGELFADVKRSEEFEAEADVGVPQGVGGFGEAFEISLAEFDFRDGAGRHDPGHHAGATDGGSEDGGVAEFGHAGLEGGVVFAEFDGEVQTGRAEIEFGEEIFGGVDAEFHGCVEINVGAGETDFGGEAGEFRPRHAPVDEHAVQRKKHVVRWSGKRRQGSGGGGDEGAGGSAGHRKIISEHCRARSGYRRG